MTQSELNKIKEMTWDELSPAEEEMRRLKIVYKRLKERFKVLDNKDQPFQVGSLVTCTAQGGSSRAKIGIVHGYYEDDEGTIRVAIGNGICVWVNSLRESDDKETLAFNLFTKDLKPIDRRLTCLI